MSESAKPPPLRLDDFEELGDVGDDPGGCHGNVRRIRRLSDGRQLVWKRIHYGGMDDCELKALLSELLVVRQLRHPNIVEYVGRIVDETDQDVYIVTEFCPNGDLAGAIRRHRREGKYIPEEKIWKWLTQLALALRCCHCRQGVKAVLHRDLKPANCFLDAGDNLKLGDFGLARVLRDSGSFASTFVGTPYYMSPEQMQKSSYTEKSDIWSLGIVAYELACLRPPFVADKQRDLAAKIKRGEFEPLPERYGPGLRRLVADCLTVREDLRPSVQDILRRPEMRRCLAADEAAAEAAVPEEAAGLRRWAEELRAFSDLLLSWQDSLARQEEQLRRREAGLAAEAVSRRAELERQRVQLDRLRDQLRLRTGQLADLQAWLRLSGLSGAAAAASSSIRSTPGDAVETVAESPMPDGGRDPSSGFEDTLFVPPVSGGGAGWTIDSGGGSSEELLTASPAPQVPCQQAPVPQPPVPHPRRSVLRNLGGARGI